MQKIFHLDNGLRIICEKLEHVNSVSVGVMIKNGSRNETPEINGISHFIEHMFFKGTTKRNAKKIFEDIENVGGQINAFTSKESTCYYVKALNTHLDVALDVLSDMILNSKFNEEDIEKEKGVITEEINMSEDLPEDVLEDISAKVTYKNSPLSMPILGHKDIINKFTREKIINFINEKYTPSNSVLSISGKFDEKEMLDLVNSYFGGWKAKEYTPQYEKNLIHSGSNYAEKDIEQLHINLSLKGLPYGDPYSYPLVLLNTVLGGGASSILFQKVREELGLCYSIYSYNQPYVGTGTINIYTGLSQVMAPKALEVIDRELKKFAKEGIKEDIFNITKEKIKANYILGLESTSSRMFSNGKSLLFNDKVKTQEMVIEQVNRISKEDIQYVLDNCFKDGVQNSAFVGKNIKVDNLNSIILNSVDGFKKIGEKDILI